MIEVHLHPALSGLPGAFIFLAIVSEAFSFFRKQDLSLVTSWCLGATCIAVIASFLSGYIAADFAFEQLKISQEEISTHHLYGKGLLILSMITLIIYFVSLRATQNKIFFVVTFRIMLVSLWFLSIITGFRGGEMLLKPRSMIHIQNDE